MFSNYGRNLAHLALHFGRVPHQIEVEEINAYLYRLTVHDKLSISFFKQFSEAISRIQSKNIQK
jgi:hypothetical protein